MPMNQHMFLHSSHTPLREEKQGKNPQLFSQNRSLSVSYVSPSTIIPSSPASLTRELSLTQEGLVQSSIRSTFSDFVQDVQDTREAAETAAQQ